ncbi:hypothetical protein [Enterococcus faecium]|uniref:hypothetical protein n=1 Tax=Enterococcus faecium TaxID=1352 RepID=UPI001F50B005|nr:hypothetical protein [Enterococcus faecium]
MIYYYHGTPNEVLEHLLERSRRKIINIRDITNDKAIQVKCVDPTGKIIVGFDIERKSK